MVKRASTTRRGLVTFLCLWIGVLCLHVPPGLAQIYSWRDEQGRLHFTDNPATIPPHLRPQSRELQVETPPESPAESQEAAPAPADRQSAAPAASEPTSPPPVDQVDRLQQRARELQQQIEAAQQERQQYQEKILAVRDVRTNPAFGRQRRRVDEWGRALADVERRLDTLRNELGEVQDMLQQAQQPALRPTPPPGEVVVDAQGHTRDYWQQRAQALRAQLQQARQQRQQILQQLAEPPEGPYGRRGDEVLQLTRALEQTEATIRETDAALQALRQEAREAGAPAEWLR